MSSLALAYPIRGERLQRLTDAVEQQQLLQLQQQQQQQQQQWKRQGPEGQPTTEREREAAGVAKVVPSGVTCT